MPEYPRFAPAPAGPEVGASRSSASRRRASQDDAGHDAATPTIPFIRRSTRLSAFLESSAFVARVTRGTPIHLTQEAPGLLHLLLYPVTTYQHCRLYQGPGRVARQSPVASAQGLAELGRCASGISPVEDPSHSVYGICRPALQVQIDEQPLDTSQFQNLADTKVVLLDAPAIDVAMNGGKNWTNLALERSGVGHRVVTPACSRDMITYRVRVWHAFARIVLVAFGHSGPDLIVNSHILHRV